MLHLDTPTEPICGDLLAQQLAEAGLSTTVVIVEDQVRLTALDESNRAAAQTVLDAHPPTAQAALAATATTQTNETTLRQRAETALADNRTFLALATPTNAQTLAQVKALTRQNNGLIRLVLGKLDGTD